MSTMKKILEQERDLAHEQWTLASYGSHGEAYHQGQRDMCRDLLEKVDQIEGTLTKDGVLDLLRLATTEDPDQLDDPDYQFFEGYLYMPDMVSDLNQMANKEAE